MEKRMAVETCVIICVYNGARFIAEALESLLKDKTEQPRILCLDDGSTDDTCSIIKKFGGRIQLHRQPHRGISAARNHAVQISSCPYFIFFDADDLWVEGRLGMQTAHFERASKTDIVFGSMEEFLSPGLKAPGRVLGIKKNCVAPGTMMCKRESFLRAGLFNESLKTAYFMDWYSRAKAANLGILLTDEVVLKRRIHSENSGIADRSLFSGEHAGALKRHLARKREEKKE